MLSRKHVLISFAALALSAIGAFAQGKGPVVGVSWSNFQEERWKTDEAAIKAAVEKAGGTYVSADAQSSPAKQLTDIESLISRGAMALIVLAQDADAVVCSFAFIHAATAPSPKVIQVPCVGC